MPDPIIVVENLSKLYQLGTIGGRTLRESLERRWYRLRGKEQLLRRVGTDLRKIPLHPSQVGPRPNTMWALKDASFTVEKGETLGIMGRNGAGKSTLLKLLARITEPTSGRAVINGRVASLLEVGTGFHPELTGRENVYLSGATLGMKKSEISRKFEEIVAFSEIGAYLDTPVKRYSSGMYVRLAFAVAAHLEPEVLIVDEVLAVGDAAFQQKCLGKMSDVAREGRTILFVSHNSGAIGRLCRRAILFEHGGIVLSGSTADVIAEYSGHLIPTHAEMIFPRDEEKQLQLRLMRVSDVNGTAASPSFDRLRSFRITVEYDVRQKVAGSYVGLMLDKADGTPVWHSQDNDLVTDGDNERALGVYRAQVDFPPALLNAGLYQIRACIVKTNGTVCDYREGLYFSLFDAGTHAAMGSGGKQRPGVLAVPLEWKTEPIDGERSVDIRARAAGQVGE
jgi:lipopolysaccharide transport system ATP-binding protein